MGLFDVQCAISGLALNDDTQMVLLQQESETSWKPISTPFRAKYNRLGGIDNPSDDAVSRLRFEPFMEWAGRVLDARSFDEALEALLWQQAELGGRKLAYALVDAQVYDALPHDLVPASPDLPNAIQVPVKSAVEGVMPTDVESGGQYFALHGVYGCHALVESARKKFADSPQLLAAVEANALRWDELDDD